MSEQEHVTTPAEQPAAANPAPPQQATAPEEAPKPEAEQQDKKGKKKQEKKKKTVGQEILSWIGAILGAVVLAMAIRALLIEPVRVDGGSMNNTLIDGEVMLVTKPEVLFGNLNRGDIVICRFPGRFKQHTVHLGAPLDLELVTHTLFVKRLVALPGDTVQVTGGVLYINDQPVDEPYVDYPPREEYPRTLMGENQYMVMGDNRAGSHDGRSRDVGPITKDMIVGRPRLVILPLGQFRTIQ